LSLAFRLIARLDIRNDQLIKTIRCEGVRKVGDPAEFVRRYDAAGIDEIYYYDAVASLYGRNSLGGLVERASEEAYCPLLVGGGLRRLSEMGNVIRRGADKVAINTAATSNPDILRQGMEKFGSQAITLQLDAKRKNGGWEAYCEGGRQPTGRDAIHWAREAVDRGVGEILVTSIDCEGVRGGFDLALVEAVSGFSVPVIAAGGFAAPPDAVAAWKAGASGIAIAGALHYNLVTLDEIREELDKAGAPVRWPLGTTKTNGI
jgi:cyclase